MKKTALLIILLVTSVLSIAETPEQAMKCLADNIYFEARNQHLSGMLAVGFVTLNRVNDPRYPNNICSVVYQKKKNTCQFSWTCDKIPNIIKNKEVYTLMKQIAYTLYYNTPYDFTDGATHYHTKNIKPYWAYQKTFIGAWGDHLVYRWDI